MAEFEVEVAGWIRVTERIRVWRVRDGSQAGADALEHVKARRGPARGFKVDALAEARDVEVVRVTPANLASAEADRQARAESQAKREAEADRRLGVGSAGAGGGANPEPARAGAQAKGET